MKRRAALAAGALALLGLVLAGRARFVQDDAFISFVYARNLAEGHGLVWFGDRVEGYTNFLWVLWMATGIRLGIEPIAWSYVGGLTAFAFLLHATWALGRILLGDVAALVALFIVVTNASVVSFATGGLETMLQAALLTQAALVLARLATEPAAAGSSAPRVVRRAAMLSLLLGAAVLTRPDSVPPALVLGVAAGFRLRLIRARGTGRALVLPFVVVVGAHVLFRLLYYGELLPNTYYAKVSWSPATASAGALYLWRFLNAYLLWPVLGLGIVAFAVRRLESDRGTSPALRVVWRELGIVVGVYCAGLVALGGDFMEFRLFVPVMPLLALWLVRLLRCTSARHGTAIAGVAAIVLAGASLQHARTFRGVTADRRLDSVPALANFYDVYPDRKWDAIGSELARELGDTEAVIALHAVGAIPYYSRLRTVDMYGLNDKKIARRGHRAPPGYRRPGHQRQVTLADLRSRQVNFVIGHPTILRRGVLAEPQAAPFNAQWVRDTISFGREPIGPVELVAMPLETGGSLLLWYLTPSAAIDSVIASRSWERVQLDVRR